MDGIQLDLLAPIAAFLSVPDQVSLGCTCRDLETKVRFVIATQLRDARACLDQWKAENAVTITLNSSDFEDLNVFAREAMSIEAERTIMELQYLALKVTTAALATSGADLLDSCCHELAKSCQGGGIFVTSLHFAAGNGDADLCRLLLTRGASVNPNIFIPNDLSSLDQTEETSNRDDGAYASQYRWGFITPMRLAMTFGHADVVELLRGHGGIACETVQVPCKEISWKLGFQCFCQDRLDDELPPLPDGACWTRQGNEEELYYKNTRSDQLDGTNHVLFTADMQQTVIHLAHCQEYGGEHPSCAIQ